MELLSFERSLERTATTLQSEGSGVEELAQKLDVLAARAPLVELQTYVTRKSTKDWPLSRREKENLELENLVEDRQLEQTKYNTVLGEYKCMAEDDEQLSIAADENYNEAIAALQQKEEDNAREIALSHEKIAAQRHEIRALRAKLRQKLVALTDLAEERNGLLAKHEQLEAMANLSESVHEHIDALKQTHREKEQEAVAHLSQLEQLRSWAATLLSERDRAEARLSEMTAQLDSAQGREAMYLAQEVLLEEQKRELRRREADVRLSLQRAATARSGGRNQNIWKRLCFCF